MAHRLPPWCREAKIALMDRNMTVSDLSNEIGVSRVSVSRTINGTAYSPKVGEKIGEYLELSTPYPDNII